MVVVLFLLFAFVSSKVITLENNFIYIGCYRDDPARDFLNGSNRIKTPISRLLPLCAENCIQWNYFSIQDGNECFCGNRYSRMDRYVRLDDSNCVDGVGGPWVNAVYQREDLSYVGCFRDDPSRDFENGSKRISDPEYTITNCGVSCAGKYRYFSVQDQNECFCGDTYSRSPKYCKLDDEKCPNKIGGPWVNSVFEIVLPKDNLNVTVYTSQELFSNAAISEMALF